jgi:hypothetical protein
MDSLQSPRARGLTGGGAWDGVSCGGDATAERERGESGERQRDATRRASRDATYARRARDGLFHNNYNKNNVVELRVGGIYGTPRCRPHDVILTTSVIVSYIKVKTLVCSLAQTCPLARAPRGAAAPGSDPGSAARSAPRTPPPAPPLPPLPRRAQPRPPRPRPPPAALPPRLSGCRRRRISVDQYQPPTRTFTTDSQ